MARKNTQVYKVASAASLAADFTTTPTLVRNQDNISYQINATTADAIGTFAVEASLDYAIDINGNVTNPGNWVPLTLGGGTPTMAGADDQIIIDLNQLPFVATRVAYTAVSGSGAADVYVTTKQVGG